MKLLLCIRCNEVFNLGFTERACSGQHTGGRYVDELNARVCGSRQDMQVLGFANSTLVQALRQQIFRGDSSETMQYAGKEVARGRDFGAFVIPYSADSVVRFETRAEYLAQESQTKSEFKS